MKPLPLFLSAWLGLGLLATGCRQKQRPAPRPAEADPAAVQAAAPQLPGQPPAAAVSTRESNDAAYVQDVSEALNNYLADYIRQHKRIPKDINEMVGLKLITSVPVLPGGKKWVIDQQTGRISAQ